MDANNQLLEKPEENTNLLTQQEANASAVEDTENAFAKVAIASFIGATVGAIAGILALKGSAQRINLTVKSVSDVFKTAVDSVNQTVKSAGDTIKNVAENVSDTVDDLGNTVKNSAIHTNDTIKDTVVTVKSTAVNVNDTFKNTMQVVKGAAGGVSEIQDTVDVAKKVDEDGEKKSSSDESSNVPDNQITYMLVPVDNK